MYIYISYQHQDPHDGSLTPFCDDMREGIASPPPLLHLKARNVRSGGSP